MRDAEAPRRAMAQTRRYAERIELAQAAPHVELASTGYGLAVPLQEYLVYLGKEVSVDLSGAERPFDANGLIRAPAGHKDETEFKVAGKCNSSARSTLQMPFYTSSVLSELNELIPDGMQDHVIISQDYEPNLH